MDRIQPPATEQPASTTRPGQDLSSSSPVRPDQPSTPPCQPGKPPEIGIGKSRVLSTVGHQETEVEVFTMRLGGETIELLPFKTWSQLDHYKWTVRGILPAEPAGLEIAPDHVRVAGETIALKDLAGCAKLERLFNHWLALERETVELARKKAQPARAAPEASRAPESATLRFRVEVDKRGQVHIHCVQGKETVASVGLTVAGLTSLHQQGLMRKPHSLAAGALHDWVELDGELCSFEKGRNDAARLEHILNQRYLPVSAAGFGKAVVVYLNAASATGFDIQFPVKLAGVLSNHRQHLNEQALELLQDPDHCGLLHRNILVKLIPPNLIFKQKTPDGGEQSLAHHPDNIVHFVDDDGHRIAIDLSQPLNVLRFSAAELTAVFNHPSTNRYTKLAPPQTAESPKAAGTTPASPAPTPPPAHAAPAPSPPPPERANPPSQSKPVPPTREEKLDHAAGEVVSADAPAASPDVAAPVHPPVPSPASAWPNAWLKALLGQPQVRHDWFACLTYSKLAEHFGNSTESHFGASPCWFIGLGESEDIADPAFKGILLTEKGSLAFLNQGWMARFYNAVAFIGPQKSALEGIQVSLLGVGLDAQERLVFILSDHYREKFGVPEATLGDVLHRLREHGALLLSVTEVLASSDPLEVVWTAPLAQGNPDDPEAFESTPPTSGPDA